MIREAINELKKYTLGKKNTEKVEISVLKLNRVIKASEQEPCEDCVSRQAVLDIFAEKADATRPYSEAWETVKKLPPVTPQPKTGHKVHDELFGGYYCSECNTYLNDYYNYCPKCGARMVETQEESEG